MKEQQKQVPLNEVWLWLGLGRSKCHKISSYNIAKIRRINFLGAEYRLEGCVSISGCL